MSWKHKMWHNHSSRASPNVTILRSWVESRKPVPVVQHTPCGSKSKWLSRIGSIGKWRYWFMTLTDDYCFTAIWITTPIWKICFQSMMKARHCTIKWKMVSFSGEFDLWQMCRTMLMWVSSIQQNNKPLVPGNDWRACHKQKEPNTLYETWKLNAGTQFSTSHRL